VPRGADRILLGQGYSVCFSGKYPTHALNQGDGERDIADLEERILVFTGDTLPFLLCFYFKRPPWRTVGVSGLFH